MSRWKDFTVECDRAGSVSSHYSNESVVRKQYDTPPRSDKPYSHSASERRVSSTKLVDQNKYFSNEIKRSITQMKEAELLREVTRLKTEIQSIEANHRHHLQRQQEDRSEWELQSRHNAHTEISELSEVLQSTKQENLNLRQDFDMLLLRHQDLQRELDEAKSDLKSLRSRGKEKRFLDIISGTPSGMSTCFLSQTYGAFFFQKKKINKTSTGSITSDTNSNVGVVSQKSQDLVRELRGKLATANAQIEVLEQSVQRITTEESSVLQEELRDVRRENSDLRNEVVTLRGIFSSTERLKGEQLMSLEEELNQLRTDHESNQQLSTRCRHYQSVICSLQNVIRDLKDNRSSYLSPESISSLDTRIVSDLEVQKYQTESQSALKLVEELHKQLTRRNTTSAQLFDERLKELQKRATQSVVDFYGIP